MAIQQAIGLQCKITENHSLIYEEDRRTALCALCPLYTPYCDLFTLKQDNIFHPKSE